MMTVTTNTEEALHSTRRDDKVIPPAKGREIQTDLNHPRLAPLFAQLKTHLAEISRVFFSRPCTANETNWAQHMLCELISYVPNVMLDKLGRKLEEMMQQPQAKRMRYAVPDTLYVVYAENEVCTHILGMWSTVDKLIEVHNDMMTMLQARYVGTVLTPDIKALINMLSTLCRRIHNLQFLLSRTSWSPSFFRSPRLVVPQPKPALASRPQLETTSVKIEAGAISETIKKECSPLPCPGGVPCLST